MILAHQIVPVLRKCVYLIVLLIIELNFLFWERLEIDPPYATRRPLPNNQLQYVWLLLSFYKPSKSNHTKPRYRYWHTSSTLLFCYFSHYYSFYSKLPSYPPNNISTNSLLYSLFYYSRLPIYLFLTHIPSPLQSLGDCAPFPKRGVLQNNVQTMILLLINKRTIQCQFHI